MNIGVNSASGDLASTKDDSIVVAIDFRISNGHDVSSVIIVDSIPDVFPDHGIRNRDGARDFDSRAVAINVQMVPRPRCAAFLANASSAIVVNGHSVDRDGGCGHIKAPSIVRAQEVLNGAARASHDAYSVVISLMIVGNDVFQQSEIAIAIDQDAIAGVVSEGKAFSNESIRAVGFLQPMESASERQISNLHQVRIIEINERLRGVVRNRSDEFGDFGGVGRSVE